MNIGIIGCGYVCDTYMSTWPQHPNLVIRGVTDIDPARAEIISKLYGLRRYASNEELLADPEIDIVVNLTSIESHTEVTRQILQAGKHVYSEKPLTMNFEQGKALVDLAREKGVLLSCAPCNTLSDTTQTMWRAVRDGLVGDVRMIYAEMDDNPIYLMSPEEWRSRSGAPWPYQHEYEAGCTIEHVGYHLTWLCAMFGPVETVTAFSKWTLPDKTDAPLNPKDTPDFSVACLDFKSGVTARVTCSIGAPWDHRMRIIGNQGMLSADTYRHYQCPVYLERFTKLSMNARKSYTVRNSNLLQWLFHVGGRRLKLIRNPPPGQKTIIPFAGSWWSPKAAIRRLIRGELGVQDKVVGIAEMADAIKTGRPAFPSSDFTLHLNELTLAIQNAGPQGVSHKLTTSFAPVEPMPGTLNAKVDNRKALRIPLLARLAENLVDRMHRM